MPKPALSGTSLLAELSVLFFLSHAYKDSPSHSTPKLPPRPPVHAMYPLAGPPWRGFRRLRSAAPLQPAGEEVAPEAEEDEGGADGEGAGDDAGRRVGLGVGGGRCEVVVAAVGAVWKVVGVVVGFHV